MEIYIYSEKNRDGYIPSSRRTRTTGELLGFIERQFTKIYKYIKARVSGDDQSSYLWKVEFKPPSCYQGNKMNITEAIYKFNNDEEFRNNIISEAQKTSSKYSKEELDEHVKQMQKLYNSIKEANSN